MKDAMFDKIENDLHPYFVRICLELLQNGIFFEGEFSKPDSQYCMKYSFDMAEAFSNNTGLHISCGYDTCYFVFFDTDRYEIHDAIAALKKYHNL